MLYPCRCSWPWKMPPKQEQADATIEVAYALLLMCVLLLTRAHLAGAQAHRRDANLPPPLGAWESFPDFESGAASAGSSTPPALIPSNPA